jgi:hypothetical protein
MGAKEVDVILGDDAPSRMAAWAFRENGAFGDADRKDGDGRQQQGADNDGNGVYHPCMSGSGLSFCLVFKLAQRRTASRTMRAWEMFLL